MTRGTIRLALSVIVLAAPLVVPAAAQRVEPQEITGTATARDGDDLIVTTPSGVQRVRLCGIDAPDRRHRGYGEAKAALGALVVGRQVRCVVVGGGTPCDGRSKARVGKRVIGQCFAGQMDLAAEMVRRGHACDWPRYSGGWYGREMAAGGTC